MDLEQLQDAKFISNIRQIFKIQLKSSRYDRNFPHIISVCFN